MRTPAGKECRYFFGDYFRGRSREECRLLAEARPAIRWSAELCFTCPVPEITLANSCTHLVLEPRVRRLFPFLKRQVEVSAQCIKSGRAVSEPKIGCGECHPLPQIFIGEPGDADTAD